MKIKKTKYDLPGVLKEIRQSLKEGDKVKIDQIDIGPNGLKKKIVTTAKVIKKYKYFFTVQYKSGATDTFKYSDLYCKDGIRRK